MPSVSQPRTNVRAEEVAKKLKGIERYLISLIIHFLFSFEIN
jgi:hypothetical protein